MSTAKKKKRAGLGKVYIWARSAAQALDAVDLPPDTPIRLVADKTEPGIKPALMKFEVSGDAFPLRMQRILGKPQKSRNWPARRRSERTGQHGKQDRPPYKVPAADHG